MKKRKNSLARYLNGLCPECGEKLDKANVCKKCSVKRWTAFRNQMLLREAKASAKLAVDK